MSAVYECIRIYAAGLADMGMINNPRTLLQMEGEISTFDDKIDDTNNSNLQRSHNNSLHPSRPTALQASERLVIIVQYISAAFYLSATFVLFPPILFVHHHYLFELNNRYDAKLTYRKKGI